MRTRIVQLIPDLGVGGAERMLLHLVTHLDRATHDVTVVALYDARGGPMEDALAASGVPVLHLGKRVGFDARMFGRIDATLRRLAPELVHTHRAVIQYALPSLLARHRGRVVHTVHNLAEHEVPAPGRVAQWIAFRAGVAPVAIGKVVADSVTRTYGVVPRAVIPNGIPVARFAAPLVTRDAWRAANGVPHDALVFACVGRLSEQKNVGALLEATRALADRGVHVRVLLVGEGPLRLELERRADALGLSRCVRFLGPRPDVPEVLGASDACVLPSRWEGTPLAVMEAMAAGAPLVATAVGGVPELVQDGETGLLVPADDVPALAERMRRLAGDPALRARLGAAARVAAERFDLSRMVAAYARLYQELLGARRAARLAGSATPRPGS